MATKFIEINGRKTPVAFSIRGIFALCEKLGCSLEEVIERLSNFAYTAETADLLTELGAMALNAGARREGLEERYTAEDVDIIFSDDISTISKVIGTFFDSLKGQQVFRLEATKPPKGKSK